MIDGVVITPLRQIPDERGKVMHMLRADAPHFVAFASADERPHSFPRLLEQVERDRCGHFEKCRVRRQHALRQSPLDCLADRVQALRKRRV